MPVPGAPAHARHAARRRRCARGRERRGRRRRAERRLRAARGRQREHAHLRRRARLASHVPRPRAARARARARRASRCALSERALLGEERALPRVACRLAATGQARGRSVRARSGRRVVDVSQGGLALRSGIDLRRRRSDRRRARRRHGRRDQRARGDRRPDRDADGGSRAAASWPSPRTAPSASGALVDRLRNSPSDGEPRARAAARAARGAGRCSPPARLSTLATLSAVELSYVTSGESHGPGITAVVSGLPAGLALDREAIRADLARRQAGYGRSPRQQHRAGRHRDPRRRAPRPHAGRAAGADRAQPRPRQLGRRHERVAGHRGGAGGGRRAPQPQGAAAAARATPTSRAS